MKPPIQEAQIRERATSQSYSRGEGYYKSGAIYATVRRGNELEGRCRGSSYSAYHVRTTLDEDGSIITTSCTCEYAYGGDCKHIVALLLTYQRKPELFEERTSVEDELAQRSQAELIALIRQMVERYPDLQALIDRPVPSRQPENVPVDTTPFRRELQQALRSYDEWDDGGGDDSAAETIRSIAEAAREFAGAGRWHDASAIYRTILEESLEQEPMDDEGEIIWELNTVLEAVVECLQQDEIATDDDERPTLINCLLDAYIWDIDMGGQGLTDGIVPDELLPHIRPEDIAHLRARVLEAQQRKGRSEYGRWGVEVYESFLLQLDTLDNTDAEATLERLRKQGLYRLVFEKLLSLGRVDEAIQIVSQHLTNSYERLLTLPRLVEVGRSDVAIRLANESLRAGFDYQLANWLDRHYQTSGNHNALFELRLLCMKQQPSVGYYVALKQASEAIDAWARVRPDILKELEQKKEYNVLAQAYLHDEAWDAAWETVERMAAQSPKPSGGWSGWSWVGTPGIDLEVAEKSKYARPHKAIPIFIKYARQQIEGRTRGHYSQAAGYLSTARDLYQKIGDENSWRELIRGIREEFRRLRALQDELNQAGL